MFGSKLDVRRAFLAFAVWATAACAALASDATRALAVVNVALDVTLDRRAVNPLIYGVNFGSSAEFAALPYPSRRWGGNTTTRYNWRFDVDNRAADYYFQRIVSDVSPGGPAGKKS